jgi:hypothetical protein
LGLTQDFSGSIEPDDPDWARAPSALKKRYYEAGGPLVLDELAKQLGKGIGHNGRQMKVRIQPVLDDGADGPVMEPHYDASRVITLADWSATDHGLKLWWHAGTGHKSHRKARKIGAKAPPFGTILAWHAEGEVPRCPVRDVRLCPQRVRNVKLRLRPKWELLKKRARIGPQSGQPIDRQHEVPPSPHPHPTPAPKPPKRPQAPRFVPGHLNPPSAPYTGEHPTPTHPIPVVTSVPKSRVKGPIFVVSGGGGAKGKAPAPKPKPKPPELPSRRAPVPKLEPALSGSELLANPFLTPQAPIESAIAFARSKGFEAYADVAMVRQYYGTKADQVLAFYSPKLDAIIINEAHRAWREPAAFMQEQADKEWFATNHPQHLMHHEVGHGLHARALGRQDFDDLPDWFARPQDEAVALKVSRYAATEPGEFVAEVYAGMIAGRPFGDDVLKLYDRLGGPNAGSAQARRRSALFPVPAIQRTGGPQLQL